MCQPGRHTPTGAADECVESGIRSYLHDLKSESCEHRRQAIGSEGVLIELAIVTTAAAGHTVNMPLLPRIETGRRHDGDSTMPKNAVCLRENRDRSFNEVL